MIGIYLIVSPTGKKYVGQSNDIERRFDFYKKHGCPGQTRLSNSFKKHGIGSHTFTILEQCELSELNARERFYQDLFNVLSNSGLNCILTPHNDIHGCVSDYTRKRMSESHMGEKNHMFGRTHNDSAKEKIRATHKGRVLTEEHKHKLSKNSKRFWKGKEMPKEVRDKISKSRIGKKLSEEQKRKISEGGKGRVFSEQHRKRIGDANRRRNISYDTRRKWMKMLVDLNTGFFFDSINDAAKCFNVNPKTLATRIRNSKGTTLVVV